MKVCLYGAGSRKIDEKYLKEGYRLGQSLSLKGHTLVFGAGSHGMMGAVSQAFKDNNAPILGISTVFMDEFEKVCQYCDKLILAETMDERKVLFVENSDCFIVSPGGIGTLDELFEILTLKRLERVDKPVIIFNIDGFYNSLIQLIKDMKNEGFVYENIENLFFVSSSVDEIVEYLDKF